MNTHTQPLMAFMTKVFFLISGLSVFYVAWYVCKEGIGFGSLPGFEIPGAIMCLGCYTAAVCMVSSNMSWRSRYRMSLIALFLSLLAFADTIGIL